MQRAWRYCLLAAAFAATAVGQSRFDVYYVAIGSEHYIEVPDPAVHTFDQIDGVRKSARAVADFFDAGGSRYGLVVISDEGRFVGSDDVYGALRKLPAKIRADRAPNPIIVFYFAGHGVSEGSRGTTSPSPATLLIAATFPTCRSSPWPIRRFTPPMLSTNWRDRLSFSGHPRQLLRGQIAGLQFACAHKTSAART